MNLSTLMLIGALAGVYCIPAVLLGVGLQLSWVRGMARHRYAMLQVLGGVLCLGITYAGMAWIAARVFYGIAEFYFDTTLGLVTGITRGNIGQYDHAVILELSLRQFLPGGLGLACFSADATVCRLADTADRLGSPSGLGWILLVLALVPVLASLAVVHRLNCHEARAV